MCLRSSIERMCSCAQPMPAYRQGRAVACRNMTDEAHYKILRILESNPGMSQRDIARELGVSLGKVNYCLKALVQKGHVKAKNFKNSQNKAGYLYLLTPGGVKAEAVITAA